MRMVTPMKTSEQIEDLCAALAKAQAGMSAATKSATNPHFKRAYADLNDCWEAAREPLTAQGLSVVQGISTTSDTPTRVRCVSRLLHTSGQWIEPDGLEITPDKATAQGIGSAATYARRYSFCALVGIAPGDDDDGVGAEPKSETPAERPHHESWEADRKRFMVDINEHGWKYYELCTVLAARGAEGNPSTWPHKDRARLLEDMIEGTFTA